MYFIPRFCYWLHIGIHFVKCIKPYNLILKFIIIKLHLDEVCEEEEVGRGGRGKRRWRKNKGVLPFHLPISSSSASYKLKTKYFDFLIVLMMPKAQLLCIPVPNLISNIEFWVK